jgi:hypothetical protein
MSTATARKRSAALTSLPIPAAAAPAVVARVTTPSEILAVLRDSARYPSPVRPLGSGSSTTRCIAANGGTLLDLSGMKRVLKITQDAVTVQPGIPLHELAEVLAEQGLELIGGFDLANRTVGGAVCGAGVEAALASNVGQFASHAIQLKVLSPSGKRFVVDERTKNLLGLMRLSYGLLGVVYEVTLRVRPVRAFAVQTARTTFKDFANLGTKLGAATAGMKLYLLPFRDRIYLELRRPAAEGSSGRKLAWRLKDWAVYSALPDAARSLGKVVPIHRLRYPLIDGLSEVTQSLLSHAMLRTGSNAIEQSGRHLGLAGKSRYTYTTWAFPAESFGHTALAYKLFCKEHYARTGFRCDMPAVSFRLNRDRSALLSPSFDTPLFSLSPLTARADGWDDFVFDFAEFAAANGGIPFFNQTKNATAEVVAQRYAQRLVFFRKVRSQLDPLDRMLNQYFAAYM